MNDLPDSAPTPEVRKGQGNVKLSREEFARDKTVQEEVRNAARNLVSAVIAIHEGRFVRPDTGLHEPRPK